MGDMADDMVAGRTCCECGLYFVTGPEPTAEIYEHGCPTACKKCFRAGMRSDGIQKAIVKTL